MPLIIPAFQQYTAPMIPLRGLWNRPPPEGDMFVNAEIDWGLPGMGGPTNCLQFALSGNSPVALSQIIALSVDNSRCASDCQFIFPDSGFVLDVPAYNQGVYPVFTNALTFYTLAQLAAAGDVTVFQILNSMPPPVPIQPSVIQQHFGASTVSLVNGTTVLLPAPTSGTLESFSLYFVLGSAGSANVSLTDGSSTLWIANIQSGATTGLPVTQTINVGPIAKRFVGGLNFVITGSGFTSSNVSVNLYYSLP